MAQDCNAAVPAAVSGASRPRLEGRMPSIQPARCQRYIARRVRHHVLRQGWSTVGLGTGPENCYTSADAYEEKCNAQD